MIDAQRVFILKQGAGHQPVADISRKAAASRATCFKLKTKRYWPLQSEMRHMKREDENAKLKKLIASISPDNAMLGKVNCPPPQLGHI